MRAFPLLFALACLGCATQAEAQTQTPKAPDTTEPLAEKDGLKISISPTYKREGSRSDLLLRSDPHINVVLQNTSATPLNIFEEWNSWGAYNLSVEITKIEGKVLDKPLIVAKGPMRWFRNFASVETIQPNEVVVREVLLQSPAPALNQYGLYGNFPFPKKETPSQITMSAVFANVDSIEAQKKKVWTGKIASPPTDYRVYWAPTPPKTATP